MWAVELIDTVKLLEARARRRLLQHVAHISMGWARGVRRNEWFGVYLGASCARLLDSRSR